MVMSVRRIAIVNDDKDACVDATVEVMRTERQMRVV